MRVYEWVSDDTDLSKRQDRFGTKLDNNFDCNIKLHFRKKTSNNMKLLINRQVEQNQSKRII